MTKLRHLCLFVYCGVQHILCVVFVLFFFVLCTLCCHVLWIVHFLLALWYSLTFIYHKQHVCNLKIIHCTILLVMCIYISGADPGFQVRGGGALKKIAPSGGRHEHFWGISCENSRFYAKKADYRISLLPLTSNSKNKTVVSKLHCMSNL